MNAKEKIKNCVRRHEDDILRWSEMLVMYGIGIAVGTKITTLKIETGLQKACGVNPDLRGLIMEACNKAKELGY